MSVIGPSSRITPASPRALAARRRRGDVVAGLQVHGRLRQPVQGDQFAPGITFAR